MSSATIRVDGTNLRTASGDIIVLQGVGLGGSLNMENFITGYPGAEFQMRKALLKVLGKEGYARFFDRFLNVFYTEEDARYLASLGLNSVRLPFNYHHFEDDARPFVIKEEGFRRLDQVIEASSRHGIYTILDLHAVPGYQNQGWHSDNPTHWAHFWTHPHFQDRVVHLWEAIADRYKENPWVAGYNPVNEPADVSGEVIGPFYRRLEAAIRAVDANHVLFLDGNRYSTDFDQLGDPLANTVYAAHDYALPGFVDGGPYPGVSRGEYVDRSVVEKTFLTRTGYMRRTGTPIWVGEFGPVYTGDPERDDQRYRLLEDQLAIYRQYGASWALWTYKDIGLQGLVHTSQDSAYIQRIAPVLEKKARLGVDAWGSVDTGVRQVLGPLEQLFAEDFPDFDPYPWGQQRWVHGIVRHVLLAEALVGDYARCFEGLNAGEAEKLADAFQLKHCVRRERLADLLRAGS